MSTTMRSTRTDSYPTASSNEQAVTETVLAQHRPANNHPKPALNRNLHLQFLVRNLIQGLPGRFVSQDASQPWIVFWTVQSFYFLGAALDPDNKQRIIDTTIACQNPNGGFGGGPKQASHLLPTYAAVSALAVVGRPGPGGGWNDIDRESMYKFFMSLKQPDGSFLVAEHSEVDIRGIYCLLCVATMLNILTPELIAGTPEFIVSLQTYEGGFASASHPYYSSLPQSPATLLDSPRPPLGEAHGGYTYCAVASWVMLKPFLPKDSKLDINLKTLARWLVNMQGSEIELGGFRGRTNKLVDACYSWWVAGCFPLLRSLGVSLNHPPVPPPGKADDANESEEHWEDVNDSLFDRRALQEYILYAGQHSAGGLRDKPPKVPDAYHTLYALSGLSTAQHSVAQSKDAKAKLRGAWKPTGDPPELEEMRKTAFIEARAWTEEENESVYVNGAGDRINAAHPIFNMTMTHSKAVLHHFYKQN